MSYHYNQFSKPRGLKGRLAGWFMAAGNGNKKRIQWAISQMQLQSTDNILEIGFGPGISLAKICEKITSGYVYGIDESAVMIEAAGKRNRKAVESGKVKLFYSSGGNLPDFEKKINKVLTINSFEFWENKIRVLIDLKKCMDTNGRIFIVHQALHKKNETCIDDLSESYKNSMAEAGYSDIEITKNNSLDIFCAKGII
ncbi:MAG: methyltransferase domain-containing protein [Spirochaetes bacterium]|nr:methyltransferase domain-containing protein [Spirochaetota bacterium]